MKLVLKPMENVVKLVGYVSRAFYDPAQIIIMDLLAKNQELKDEDLARCLNMQTKDLNKVAGKLRAERLIKIDTRYEDPKTSSTSLVENSQFQKRKVTRLFYYIDYKQLVNVVKWKIHAISKILESQVSNQISEYSYKCSSCLKGFSMFDVNTLEFSADGFKCDQCASLLIDDTVDTHKFGTSERYSRFMDDIRPIVDILRETDKLSIAEYIPNERNLESVPLLTAAQNKELAESKEMGATNGDIIIEFDNGNNELKNGVDDIDGADDYYKDYYANIHASNSATRTYDEDDEDEEFVSVDTTNSFKRSRELEETDSTEFKKARVSESDNSEDEEFIDASMADALRVIVSGESIPLYLVTENHRLRMSAAEFKKYEEIVRNGKRG